jgi:hypothetical protein
MMTENWNSRMNKAAGVRQWHSEQVSTTTDKHATIEDAVFPMGPLLGNGSVNMLLQQQIWMQQ